MHNSPKCLLCPRPPPRQDGDLVLLHLEFASFAARWSTSFLGVSIELLSLMVLVLFVPFFRAVAGDVFSPFKPGPLHANSFPSKLIVM